MTLDGHASMLGQILEEAQTNNDQKLSELENKFEVTNFFIFRIWIDGLTCKFFLSGVFDSTVGVCCP